MNYGLSHYCASREKPVLRNRRLPALPVLIVYWFLWCAAFVLVTTALGVGVLIAGFGTWERLFSGSRRAF